jgi:copper homeostasis protein
MYSKIQLEIATFTLEGALIAEKAGANRIELCENPNDGGTTPSYGTLKTVRSLISIPVFPIIRPRGGNFVYSSFEIEVIKQDIICCKELGYTGIVVGVLTSIGDIDFKLLNEFVQLASPMEVTFHRAFDRCKKPSHALEQIIESGCTRILTSGQYPSVVNGIPLLKKLIEQANHRISIMPGSGVNSQNIAMLHDSLQAQEYHTAARIKTFHTDILSPETMNEQLSYVSVDAKEVEAIRYVLNSME